MKEIVLIKIKKIDHLVITTADIKKCLDFYTKLGFTSKDIGSRYELYAGDFKINVHILGAELLPHAQNVQTGSTDLCFEINTNLQELKTHLQESNFTIEQGIVARTGVLGPMNSIYLRDPDGNLLEFCNYQ